MIVDGHVHVGKWLDQAYSSRSVSFAEMVKELSGSGVGAAFVFPTDAKDNAGLLSEVVRHGSGKDSMGSDGGLDGGFDVYFFPWVDIDAEEFGDFLEKEKDRVSGLKFHPSYARKPVTDPAFDPFFAFARENNVPVIIHCGRWQEVAGYKFALDRAETFREVPFVLSHLGGDLPGLQLGAFEAVQKKGLDNVLFGTESIREYWNLERGIQELGAHRFLFGSDFALGHPNIYRPVVELLSISEDEKALVLGQNALDLVGRSGK